MKKKILIIAVMLCIVAVTQAHAFGFGVQLNYSFGYVTAPGFSVVFCQSPMTHIAVCWFIDPDVTTIGLIVDFSPVRIPLFSGGINTFYFALGLGLFSNFSFESPDNGNLDIGILGGLRIPVGFRFFIGRNFELYTHIAPSFGVRFIPNFSFSDPFFPVGLGVRVWFR